MSTREDQETWRLESEPDIARIHELDLHDIRLRPVTKFVIAFAIGFVFFLVPVPWQGEVTVPFDIVVSYLTGNYPQLVGVFALLLILAGGVFTTLAEFDRRGVGSIDTDLIDLKYYETALSFWILRVIGAVLAPIMFFELGPGWLHTPSVGGLMWGSLILSVAVIVPIGAIFINLFVELGGLEFVGTLARPIMRPLFRVPGRAALDSLASWVGSYSVGLYVTRNVFNRGEYNKRDVYIISTCFGTVSIGFVGVVAAAVDLLQLFPIIFLAYFISVVVCAAILVRLPPLSTVPNEYVNEPSPETPLSGSVGDYFRFALSEAVREAEEGDTFLTAAARGLVDGLKLISLIIGTILAVGLAALLIAEYTPVFGIISAPLVPLFELLGYPNADTVATASIIGITEMYIPSLLIAEAAARSRFFIAVLSISQLIFFSSVGPMMMDMFNDIPIRFRDLVILFVMRTIILIPLVTIMTYVVEALGLL
jgi:nucleoside recognition membrane protein YjiH